MWYLYVGLILTIIVDVYTKVRNVKEGKFKNTRERLGMMILCPLFVVSVLYSIVQLIKNNKNDKIN